MEVKEYKGTKNDLVIGLVNRFVLTGKDKIITISLLKKGKEFEINQWAMDSDGNELETYRVETTGFRKKYYAMQEIKSIIKKYVPTYGEKKVYKKRK